MTIKTCRHCDMSFQRDDAVPIPHDRCERCHDEIEALAEAVKTGRKSRLMEDHKRLLAEKREILRGAKAPVYDPVNHPAHYQSDEGIECIDAIRAALGLEGFVAHCRGTALKYTWRAGSKGDAAECLRKGAWYLERAAQELEQ